MRNPESFKTTITDIVSDTKGNCRVSTDEHEVLCAYEYLFHDDFENYIGRRVKVVADSRKNIIEILDLKDKKNIYRYNINKVEVYEGTAEHLKEARKIIRQSVKWTRLRALELEKNKENQILYKQMKLEIPYELRGYAGIDADEKNLTIDQMADIERYVGIYTIIKEGFSSFSFPEAHHLAREVYANYLKIGKRIPFYEDGYRSYDDFIVETKAINEYLSSSDDNEL